MVLTSIPVLLVEDEPAEAVLIQEMLSLDEICDFTMDHVDHLGGALARLQERDYHSMFKFFSA